MLGRATQALIASSPVTFYCNPFFNTVVFVNRVIWKSIVNTCVLGNIICDRGTGGAEGSVWG